MTGAAGFIGAHLCVELAQAGHTVHGIDRPDGDLTVPGAFKGILDDSNPDVVVHLAAQVGRLLGEDDLRHTIESNATMTTLVANACRAQDVRLVYASTSEIYGDQGLVPVAAREDDRTFGRVHNLYGLSKRWGEEACRLYAPDGLTVWRISMPYGPGLPAGRGRAAMINFLYNALHRQQIPVHRGAERSWCFIGDTVRAMRLTIEDPVGGTFNIGRDDNAEPLRVTAERACDLTGAPHSLIVDVDPPANQTIVKRLATSKIRALGWQPEVTLEDGMRRTLEWVRTLP